MWTVLNSVLSTVLLGEARDLDKQPQCIPSFMDCTSYSTVTIKQIKKRKEYSPRTLPFLQVGVEQDCRTGFIDSKTGGKQTRTRGASACQRLLSTNKNFYGTCAARCPSAVRLMFRGICSPLENFWPRWLRHAFHLFYAAEIAKVASILFPSAHRFSLPLRKTMGS